MKKSKEAKARLTADIDEELHRKLKTAAAARDMAVRDYLERLLEAAFTADPYVQAVEATRRQESDRLQALRRRIEARVMAAEHIKDSETRERVLSRGRAALEDPLADLAEAVATFSAMSAASVRRESALGEAATAR